MLIIELLRDAWLATKAVDAARAHAIALSWFNVRYPTFKRLALFAATQDQGIENLKWVSWLVSDDACWLWSVDTTRETMRALVLRGRDLAGRDRERLEAAICTGPSRSMFRDDLNDEDWKSLVDRNVWLRLAKLSESGGTLGPLAAGRLESLSAEYPDWELSAHERDEFTHWMSGTGDPDYEHFQRVEAAPVRFSELVEWLKKSRQEVALRYEDNWRKICREKFYRGFAALYKLTKQGLWPVSRWQEALQAWSEETQAARSWRFVAPLLEAMPAKQFDATARTIGWWLSATSKVAGERSPAMARLCGRMLAVPFDTSSGITRQGGEPIDRPVTEAINHPVGHVAQALFSTWFKRNPGDGDLLPDDLRPLLTQLCDVQIDRYRHGRVILAANLIALFRVDPDWTQEHLLRRFDWAASAVEAKSCWEGFLWSPRLYRPLLIAFKPSFLETANHYLELGEHRHQYVSLLTFAALNEVEGYFPEDFRVAISRLPQDGLRVAARSLQQAMDGAGEQRSDFWKNRVAPFWHDVWPKNRELASPQIANALALMCITAAESFGDAFNTVSNWMRPNRHPNHVVERLWTSGACSKFPLESLRLLRAILSDDEPLLPTRLSDCLSSIVEARPSLVIDLVYASLMALLRARG